MTSPVQAATGINQQINFQGRLLNGQGAVVPDGFYNIQFKIYQDGNGQTAGNTTGSPAGSLKWTESLLNVNSQGVRVVNGFLSVQLGAVTPFGSNVDWNQDTLWLSMNVATVNPTCASFAVCTPDGEMVPMKRLSSSVYALNSGMLGGLTSAGFIQNTATPQTANFNVTGNGVIGGTLSVTGLVTATAGLTVSGAAVNLNNNSNFAVNIATGTSTGLVSIGGGANTFSLNTTNIDISAAGAISGATGVTLTSGNITTVGTVQGATVNATTAYQINGTNILAAGALSFTAATTATIQSAAAQALNITGNATSTISTTAGDLTLSSAAASVNIQAAATQSILIGTAASNTITLGTTTATSTITVGRSTASNIISIGSNNTTIGNIQTINIGAGAPTGTGRAVVTIGNTNDASAVNLNAGTGGVNINGATSVSGTNTFTVGSGAVALGGTLGVTGLSTFSGGITATNGGNVSFQRGSDFTVVGTTNNANLGTGALVRINGASSQTLTGIGGGVDGRILTLINAGPTAAVITNNDAASTAANRVVTGTGGNLLLPAGSSVSLIYDSGASIWRVTGTVAATGGSGINTVGTFLATSVVNGASISGTTITFGSADGTNPGMVNTGPQSFAGAKSFSGLVTASAGLTASGATVSLNASSNNDVSLATGTSTGLVTIGGGSGTFALDTTSLDISSAGALSGITGIAMASGNIAQSGTGSFSTGTGTVSLNGDVAIASGRTLTVSGTALFKPATNSVTAFQVQPSGSTIPVFNVDTTNSRIGVGTAAPGYPLDVVGDINSSTQYRIAGTIICTISGCTPAAGSTNYIQNGITTQASSNFNISGSGTAGTSFLAPLFDTASAIALNIGTTSATAINLNQNVNVGANRNLVLASGTGTFTQTYTGVTGNAASITAGPASGTIGASLNVANTGAGTVTNGILVDRTSGGTTTNGIAITNTAGTMTNGLTFAGTIGTDISRGTGTLTANGGNGIALSTNGVVRASLDTANNLTVGNGGATGTAAAPSNFIIRGTGSSTTGVAGGLLGIQGGAATVGNANGGNLNLSGGTGFGTGVSGLVVVNTPTFLTAGSQACATTCTINQSNVDGNGVVVVNATGASVIASLPNPTITGTVSYGRIVYVTAASGSNEFTLSVNGGGNGNLIAMRQNTTATMIWGSGGWTAAGASSSTTLQSAYDNTLQSAGGAELIVSKTGTTNGLTIRDSSTTPVNGTLLSVQTSSAAVLLSVNSNVTEYASNGGAEVMDLNPASFPVNTWTAAGTSPNTVTRYTTAGSFIATGQASVAVATTLINHGVENRLTTSLTANTNYNVSFATRLAAGTFTDMNVYYSVDGTANSVTCKLNQAVATSVWTKVNCTFVAPSVGVTANNAIIIRQGSAGARTFHVENLSVTIAADYNYATDGSVNDALNFATNWSAVTGGGTVVASRDTSLGFDASDSARAQITTATAGAGIRNKLAINPLATTPGTLYRVTVYASSSTAMTDFTIRYSRDGGTNFDACVDYSSQTLSGVIADFKKITCYVTPSSTAPTNPNVYFTQTAGAARSIYVDAFSMTLASDATPNVQVGGGILGGPTTLFTLDKGASAPIASDNDALLGSMYYDTSLGKLQCYEADGWGACGSSPDNVITISPEYTNAVMHGTGVGTMTSDICSGTLDINDGSVGQPTICGAAETYNFYKWTSPQPSAQTYGIYVTYQLPSAFKGFVSGQTSIMGRTDNANATVNYQVYRSDAAGLVQCGSIVPVSTGVQTAWQPGPASGAADPSTCNFAAGDSIVFKINVTASTNANAYVGNLNFTFSNK